MEVELAPEGSMNLQDTTQSLHSVGQEEDVLHRRERKYLTALAFGLGFSQGCGLCFYVAAGSYFSNLFANPRFFVNACAFFYLPPILATIAQLAFDSRFEDLLGIRPVIRFRIIFSSLVMGCLLVLMGQVAGASPFPGQGRAVYGIGVVLGTFTAVLLGSSCLLFGAVDPRFVPYLILGQTAAGVYTNAAARALGFAPGCEGERALAFFTLAAGTVLLITGAYQAANSCKLLERTYQRHEVLLSLSRSQSQSTLSLAASNGAGGCPEASPVGNGSGQGSPRVFLGFPPICWCMAACQTVAIAMNMSLTPLSNQVAHGEYDLSQELVLVKLLSDFVGRGLFLLLPKPRPSSRWRLHSVRGHAVLVWLVELLRFPLWLSVFLWARGSRLPRFLANQQVLLWPVWMPLISSGAFSASWCFVICVTAAPEDRRRSANLLMSVSVYAGFFLGIVIALATV